MKHILLNTCVALATLAANIPPAAADPPARDISAEIAAHRADFITAKLIHLADSASYRRAPEEEEIAQDCFYPATGEDLAALLDVLVAGGLHETTPHSSFEIRTIVYLAKRDGSTAPLLLNARFPNSPVYGTYERNVPIAASPAFNAALHDWMTHRIQINPRTSKPCTGFHLD